MYIIYNMCFSLNIEIKFSEKNSKDFVVSYFQLLNKNLILLNLSSKLVSRTESYLIDVCINKMLNLNICSKHNKNKI
jgi:hypothetical protein